MPIRSRRARFPPAPDNAARGRRGRLRPPDHLCSHIDETRRPHRRETPGLDGHDPSAREPLPVEVRSALFEALQDLPLQQRKVVVLRHWLGLDVRETARELGLAEGTVKSHSSRRWPRWKHC